MDWWWWFRNIVHIETIFFIIIIVLIIYFLITKEDRSKSLFEILRDKSTFKKHFKRKRRKNRVPYEERCRKIFEHIYQCKFKKVRPDWLKNPHTGKNLELDGYNADIETPLGKGLAFEYDGRQHSEYTPFFHKTKQDFLNQRKRDIFKDKQCYDRGILLIRVPYYIPDRSLGKEIKERIQLALIIAERSKKRR